MGGNESGQKKRIMIERKKNCNEQCYRMQYHELSCENKQSSMRKKNVAGSSVADEPYKDTP